METEGRGIVLFQAGYTPPEVLDDALANAEPVEDQCVVAASLLGRRASEGSRPADADDTEDPDDKFDEGSPDTPAMSDAELLAEMHRRGLAPTEPVAEKPAPARKPRKAAAPRKAAPVEAPKSESTPAPESDTEGW